MDPLIVTQAINVLYGISTLAVLALGLAVIFGLLGVLNIAHGEFVMIGAYCAYVTQAGGLPFLAAVPLTLAVCAILGCFGLARGNYTPRIDEPPNGREANLMAQFTAARITAFSPGQSPPPVQIPIVSGCSAMPFHLTGTTN